MEMKLGHTTKKFTLTKDEFVKFAKERFLTQEKLNSYREDLEKQKKRCNKIKMSDRPFKVQVEYKNNKVKMGLQPSESYVIDKEMIDYDNNFYVNLGYENNGNMSLLIEYTGNAEGFYCFQHFIRYNDNSNKIFLEWQYKADMTIKTLIEEIEL